MPASLCKPRGRPGSCRLWAVGMGAAGEKKDVDAIWAQLNAKSAGKGSARAERVFASIKSGNDPAKPRKKPEAEKESLIGTAYGSKATERSVDLVPRGAGSPLSLDVSGVASEEELSALLQRDLYGLKDTAASTRKNALIRLNECVQVSISA